MHLHTQHLKSRLTTPVKQFFLFFYDVVTISIETLQKNYEGNTIISSYKTGDYPGR